MITGSLSFVRDKNRFYNTEFRLFPKSQKEPIFIDPPINIFKQTTWVSEIDVSNPSDYILKNIIPSTNQIGMLEGTGFEIDMQAVDPSNLLDPGDDSNITYIWKKDGSPLFEFSSQNNLRGTKKLTITSESCTREVSGVYELEATNRFGTTTSDPIIINVIDEFNNPFLFKNLLINGSGEKGLDGWNTDQDIIVRPYNFSNRAQSSIPPEVYSVNYFSPYSTEFGFSYYANETNLARWFERGKDYVGEFTSQNPNWSYNRWIIKNFLPNLVPTDGGCKGFQDSFFPSWDYIDTYNQNNNLYKLNDIIGSSYKYITRDKIKFAVYGGKAKSIAYQDIDLTDAQLLVDGETYGVDQVVAHFFAYVGIGISTYEIDYHNANTDTRVKDNLIPINYYNYKVGAMTGRPSLLPLYDGPITTPNVVKTYDAGSRDRFCAKVKKSTPIELTPICYDKVVIRLDFLNISGEVVKSENIPGPTEKDIWAVKEKFFLPYYIANLYGWTTDATNNEFRFYSQSYTTIDAVRAVDTGVGDKDINADYVKRYRYPLTDSKWELSGPETPPVTLTTSAEQGNRNRIAAVIEKYGFSKSFIQQFGNTTIPEWYIEGSLNSRYDLGAAAFFGIQKDVVVPKGTRTIRVNIIFDHTSNTIYDGNPRAKGWTEQEIYYDVYTRAETSRQFVEYGYPRAAVTAMHLSLHPNSVDISEKYHTYNVNLDGSVWKQQLDKLTNPAEYDSRRTQGADPAALQYTYAVSTIPNYVTTVDPEDPITVADIATIFAQYSPFDLQPTGSAEPLIPEPPVEDTPFVEPDPLEGEGGEPGVEPGAQSEEQ